MCMRERAGGGGGEGGEYVEWKGGYHFQSANESSNLLPYLVFAIAPGTCTPESHRVEMQLCAIVLGLLPGLRNKHAAAELSCASPAIALLQPVTCIAPTTHAHARAPARWEKYSTLEMLSWAAQ